LIAGRLKAAGIRFREPATGVGITESGTGQSSLSRIS
jgi:hypothetical protein